MTYVLEATVPRIASQAMNTGKKVAKELQVVATLMAQGDFQVVAERVPEAAVDARPTDPAIVGLQPTFEKVWRCLIEESAGIISLYGMGGVGKTTLLTQINNKFLGTPINFDVVIWVSVSKDLQYEKIQEMIGKKIGLFDEFWKNRGLEEKASNIFKILSKKKFVLLLDDVWERVDLTRVGVPTPGPGVTSKIVFTTRILNVCGLMETQRRIKVECLAEDEALKLFQKKVGEDTLESHPSLPQLAQLVAKECGGLPLALITIGRAMSCKKTPEEWSYAIQVLRKSASKFSGMGKEVYPLLKFSYDCLSCDKVRSCLLYCSLFSEDYSLPKSNLIECWISEGFLDEFDNSHEARNYGYSIIGDLVSACLLEEEEEHKGEYELKMHDVIRDMALWIACEVEKEKEHFSIHAGAGLTEAPKVEKWEGVRRMSLMQNKVEYLSDVPACRPDLLTLFLDNNKLKMITSGFFQFMPSLKVLILSNNISLTELPCGISKLVALQHLDLSVTGIKELPVELKALRNLKCLGLECTFNLHTIPLELISSFSMLYVLRMFQCSGEIMVEELLGLKHLIVLTITLSSVNALQRLLSSAKLQSYTQSLCLLGLDDSKSFNILSLVDLKNLHTLDFMFCETLEEMKIDKVRVLQKTGQPYGFHSLHKVHISYCPKLRDLTWLLFAPKLKSIFISPCDKIEEIISAENLGEFPEMMENLYPFTNLESLGLQDIRNLKSIYWKALPFPHLKEIYVVRCPNLKKLPLDSNSEKGNKVVITGEEHRWKELQWEDEATRKIFLPCFRSLIHG